MRDLWRSTVSLLWQHPILWLPVAILEFVDFSLQWLEQLFRHWFIQKLLLQLSEKHSVLSNSPIYNEPTQHAMNRAIVLTAPLDWCVLLVYNLLLTCAIVATAAILLQIAQTGSGTLRDAITPIKTSIRRIRDFALTLYGLNLIGHFLTSFLAPQIQHLNLDNFQSRLVQMLEHILSLSIRSQIALEQANLFNNLFANLWPIPITLCVVYIIAPLQVRLLLPPNSGTTAKQTRHARILWFLAIVAFTVTTCATFILQTSLSFALHQSLSIIYSFEVVRHLISIAIYAALFVAIYLIAYPESPLAIPPIQPITPPDEEDTPTAEEAP